MDANKRIAALGQKKRLKEAVRIFEELETDGLRPTVHTYTSLLNAHVRDGDLSGAKKLFERMQAAHVEPNVVTYTALLKGYCAKDDMGDAAGLLQEMRERSVDVNMRTANTFLRGCLRVGEIDQGLDVFRTCAGSASSFSGQGSASSSSSSPRDGLGSASADLRPDAPACEAVVRLLAQALRTEEAEALLASLPRELDSSLPPNLDPLLNPCPQLLLAEAWALLGRQKRARRALSRAEKLLGRGPPATGAGSGSLESVDLFLKHRWQELQRDAATVTAFLEAAAPRGRPAPGLEKSLARFAYFRGPDYDGATGESLAAELDRAGILGCRPQAAARARSSIRNCLSARGRLRVRSLLGVGRAVPVKVEVCSGAGDWVAAQASADAGQAAWVALELRHDRCVQISRNAARRDLSNLLVLGGDAAKLVSRRLARRLATHVYVNFPEPPAWHENSHEVSAAHLLTPRFMRCLSRLLVPGGILIVVSDNQSYLTSLAQAAHRLRGAFVEAAAASSGHGLLAQGLPEPGPDTGLAAPFGESYFHRLWAMGGKKKRRFHLRLTRPPPPSRPAAAGRTARPKRKRDER